MPGPACAGDFIPADNIASSAERVHYIYCIYQVPIFVLPIHSFPVDMTSHDLHSHQSSHPSMDSTLEPGTATRTHSPPLVASSERQKIDEKEPITSKSGIDTENHPKALEAGVAGTQEPDVIVVGWDGPDDVDNPKKYVRYTLSPVTSPDCMLCSWTKGKKWVVTAVVSSYTFVSPFSSSIVSPAAAVIGEEFNITNSTLLSMVVSVFVLAYGAWLKVTRSWLEV